MVYGPSFPLMFLFAPIKNVGTAISTLPSRLLAGKIYGKITEKNGEEISLGKGNNMATTKTKVMFAGGVACCMAAAACMSAAAAEKWNMEAREKFAAQRFGIFIHWGLYANYAQGEWYLHNGGNPLDEAAYSRMQDGFYPSKFDAREWVRVFKDAGAKYVTITSRHHDGFSLWPTKVDDGYNIANTPFKRDIVGEIAKACDEAGLQLNFYYSLMDWHRKDYPPGSVAVKHNLPGRSPDYASYKKFMLGQIGELIDNYRPGNIWFDGEWEHAKHQDDGTWKRTLDWDFDTIYDFIHSKHVLVANNNHQPIREKEDIQLFERDLPGDNSDAGFSKNQPVANDRPIEQCDVIQKNVWGYRINEREFRTAEDVCAMICRCAAKDSNLLMNIGPDGSGRLPARAVEVMAEVGKWMRANGNAIYGTRGLGLVKNADGSETGKTKKGDAVYVISIPKGGNAFPKVEEL